MSLVALTESMAVAAVETQRRFDREAEMDGPRMRIARLAIENTVHVSRASTAEFGLNVKPVGIGLQMTHQLKRGSLSQIVIQVEQVAVPLVPLKA